VATGQPVISVDTRKKELVGAFANKGGGATQRFARGVQIHDFVDQAWPCGPLKASTTGGHEGFVGIGTDNHTAFAVTTIGRWWEASAQRPTTRPPGCSSPPMPGAPTAFANCASNRAPV